ncbi:hypothetical protein SISNIDRAFT_54662 [Sistotremastrum niveocremeum HHB9708]|uniref:Uncharacterized protein n=1 Tax=Sistotremastrum niveocremeum HHB9708 TaxID=1314777 RepID=A0A164VAP0_9AGAM|nr:hypothetical protein SISNIDRAFT_54662 [Sistotremastrum niveocremeum HHB9708]
MLCGQHKRSIRLYRLLPVSWALGAESFYRLVRHSREIWSPFQRLKLTFSFYRRDSCTSLSSRVDVSSSARKQAAKQSASWSTNSFHPFPSVYQAVHPVVKLSLLSISSVSTKDQRWTGEMSSSPSQVARVTSLPLSHSAPAFKVQLRTRPRTFYPL